MTEPICHTYANGDKYWYLNGFSVHMEDVITDPKEQFWWTLKHD